jgi:hypothetical protein
MQRVIGDREVLGVLTIPEFEFRGINFSCSPARCYDIAPDGEHFITTDRRVTPPRAPVTHIQLVQNWLEELKARVPTK